MEIMPIISFFTGVISILSPCIIPTIPIIVGFSLKTKSKAEILSFIFGLFSIFTIIIFLTGFFTAILYRYIIYVRVIAAVVLLIMGILMYFDYNLSFKSIGARSGGGIVNSFILGFLTSIAWADCYSAYLISLITLLVSSNSPLYAVVNILIYVLGFALTLLALCLAISRIDLEKLISKTSHIPKIFAILIIIGAFYLFYTSIQVFL
ncbi:cytochrome c biogenesis CcdA family protein [Methanobrevibacter sp.]|uniref:cytochrome c biogenesis CcdA family protein n=1 Tax=Methanobrevibacter sp. TaxID=66852 RepID=UPI0038668C08